MQLDRLNKRNLWFSRQDLSSMPFPSLSIEKAPFPSGFGTFSFLCGRGHSGSAQKSRAHTVGTLKGATWARSRAWERWQAGQNDSLSTFVSVLTIA